MKPRNLLIVFIVFVAVVSFYVVLEKVYLPKKEKEKEKENKIFTLESKDLNTIKITTGKSNLILVREKGQDRWTMTAPVETGTDSGEVESFIVSALDAETTKSLGTKKDLRGSLSDFGLVDPKSNGNSGLG